MSWDDRLLVVWILSAIAAGMIVVGVLVWAIRSGQFRRQDHASRLPLESHIPDKPADEPEQRQVEPRPREQDDV